MNRKHYFELFKHNFVILILSEKTVFCNLFFSHKRKTAAVKLKSDPPQPLIDSPRAKPPPALQRLSIARASKQHPFPHPPSLPMPVRE